MPIRKITPSRAFNCRGLLSSSKSVGAAMYESSLERDYLMLLDFDRSVKRFEVQPTKIDMRDQLGYRHYRPDVLVEFERGHGRPWLVEVKYEEDLQADWAELKPRFRAAIRFCKPRGWVFHLVTERHVRTTLLDNVKFLRDFRNLHISGAMLARLALLAERPRCVQDLACDLGGADESMALSVIWHALWTGNLVADLDCEMLSPQTEVQWHGSV